MSIKQKQSAKNNGTTEMGNVIKESRLRNISTNAVELPSLDTEPKVLNISYKDLPTNGVREIYAPLWKDMKDVMGKYRITSLFWEHRSIGIDDRLVPLFTIKDRPHTVPSFDKKSMVTYPSLKNIYFSYTHVPGLEYEFAMDVFNSWNHWKAISESYTCKNMVEEWRDELAILLKCKSIKNLIDTAEEQKGTSIGVTAAKYLADEAYVSKKRGRVSKEEKNQIIKREQKIHDTLTNDMERLGLQVVSGGKV